MKFLKRFLVIGVLLTTVLIGGVTWGFASHDTNTIHACVAQSGSQNQSQNMQGQGNAGSVRIVDSETDCRNGETHLTWNIVGPPGPPGPEGPQGPAGPPGPQGDPGVPCDGCVDTASLADGAVTEAKLADGAVTSAKIADGSIQTVDLADNSVTSAKIQDGPGSELDADLLDGLDSSDLALATHNHDSSYWSLTGNSGTNPSSDFVGTTDNQPLVFKTNGTEAMRIDAAGNVGIGTASPLEQLHAAGNVRVDGKVIINAPPAPAGLSVTGEGIGASNLQVKNAFPGGIQWNIYTGDNGCFGDSLGIGPTVPEPAGQCGGPLGASIIIGKNGDLHVIGTLSAGGAKSAVVDTEHYGKRALYAAETPEVRFFDEGLAQLENGVTRVDLDPIFLDTIEGEYLVHVTPYGNASLYVAEIGEGYFVVRVRDGNPDVSFAWRLSAYRKGYAGVRLEQVGVKSQRNEAFWPH